ncbi:MAG: BTAD domain-containing putative transcriptional regulator [Acidimicrobiia bacterium]|nr:BTAD domain-containing putative transcriptional regulator [Acidimicrobiia bacterium]
MADVEFRVLGTGEVLIDGAPLAIDAPKQRALLTLLLIHANEVQSTDRILDALWGEEAPASGVNTLRYHVSKLRSALGSHADLIVSRESGYELVTSPESIDSRRFETLFRQAREVVVTDPMRAAEVCHHALELWRGSAFADFPYDEFVQAEARRLNEMRMEAIELRIAAFVAAGQDAHLVPELESLVAEHPLRENLWSHLMLVLYRSGRQPEALRAYQRAREVFGDLGTEPSDDLAALEEKILLRDPSLTAEPEQVKGNLPLAADHFVGRAEEIGALQDLVSANRLVSIVGPGGVGKTRLAIEAARGLEDESSGGVWLVEYVAIDQPDLVASQVAAALGVLASAQGRDPLDHLASHIRESNTLLVIDNCEHLVEPIGLVVSALLARCPQLRVLATSRRPLGVRGEMVWRATPMSLADEQSEALQLFLERGFAARPDLALTAESEDLALEVCRRLDGLPLALELAAARLRMMSLEQLAARLDDAFAVVAGGPRDKPEHQRGLRALMDWSYQLLEPDEQRLFRFASVFRGGFTLDSAEHLLEQLGASRNDALDLVGALVDSSLLTMTADDRYTMLELIREYGLILLEESSEIDAARDAHLAVFRQAFYVPAEVVAPLPDQIPTVWGRFDAEIDNARAAVAWALQKPDPSAAVELGATVWDLLMSWHLQNEAHDLNSRLLAVTSEPSGYRAKLLRNAMYSTAANEGTDRAVQVLEELEATAETLDDDTWRGVALGRRGVLEFLRGDTDSAWRYWDDAADLLSSIGSSLAWHPTSTAFEVAMLIGDFERVRRLAARVADDPGLPDYVGLWFLGGSAFAAAADGDVETAEQMLEQYRAKRTPEARDDHDVLALISLARMDFDDVEQRATSVLERGRSNLAQYDLYLPLFLLGIVQFHRGDMVVARRYFTEGLADTARLEMKGWQLWWLAPVAATFAGDAPALCLTLLAASDSAHDRVGGRPYAAVARIVDEAAGEARSRLTLDEIKQAEESGAAMTLDEAVELALSFD